MPKEAPVRPVNSEALARKMARAEKPFKDMRLNAQRVKNDRPLKLLKNLAFVAGEKAYWLDQIGWAASPTMRIPGISVLEEDKYILNAALGVKDELIGKRTDLQTPYGTKLTDEKFQQVRGESVVADHSVVTRRISTIKDMLGVSPDQGPEDISTQTEISQGITVNSWDTNMGLYLFEVTNGDTVNLYVNYRGSRQDPISETARNVRVKEA